MMIGDQANKLATKTSRFFADLIDVLVVIVLTIFTFYLPVVDLIGLAYYLFRDALPFLGGQSIGKKLMKIRVIMIEKNKDMVGEYGAAFFRSFLQVIPVISIIDAIFIFGDRRQRLGDRIAKTNVIKVI